MNVIIKLFRTNQLFRYFLIGGLSFAVEMGILFTLRYVCHFSPVVSVGISFWVGFSVAYILQKVIVFKSTDYSKKVIAKQVTLTLLLVAWNYIFTLTVVHLLESVFSVIIIRTVVIIMTTTWNFYIYKIIFKSKTD